MAISTTVHRTINEIDAGFGAHNMDAPELWLLSFSFPNGLPQIISPAGGTTLRVAVSPSIGQPQPNTGVMFFKDDSTWDSIAMSMIDTNIVDTSFYDAVFPPAECGTPVSYYLRAQTIDQRTQLWPPGAPNRVFHAVSATSLEFQFSDSFDVDLGWTVENGPDLRNGVWERGIPIGQGELNNDPPMDFDGSGYCYLTGNRFGHSDVDCDYTRLISPCLDLSAGTSALVYYALWYKNLAGETDTWPCGQPPLDSPHSDVNVDTFKVYVSNDNGQNWSLVEAIGYETEWWEEHGFMLNDFIDTLTNQVKISFEVSDTGSRKNIVEAAVDAFDVKAYNCVSARGDVNGDSVVDIGDVVYLINYLFTNGPKPACLPISSCADVSSDGLVDVSDVIYLINYLFRGGPPPAK